VTRDQLPQQPNIVLFVTEQHRGDCLGIEGHPVLMTPNMDAIAGSGVRFAHAYSSCPTCIAARRSLLSGQYPSTHGMVGYCEGVEWDIQTTLPALLSEAGYETAWIGRSMHQYPPDKRFGFEYMVTLEHRVPSDYSRFFQQQRPDDREGVYGTGVMHNDWTARPWHLEEDLHPTNWTVHEALRFLHDRDMSRPFFLVVSTLAAHPPLVPPAFYLERYIRTGVPDPVIGDWAVPPPNGGKGMDVSAEYVDLRGEALLCARAGYYGLLNHLDDQIRRLLNPVTGIPRMTGGNTVIALTSDHGEMLGDHCLWRKTVPYEASARIPLLLRAPPRFGIRPGTVVQEPVGLEDVLPTLLDLAGVPVPETVEGQSLLPLARGERTEWRPYIHIEHAPVHHALTDGKEKYIWFAADGREQFFCLAEDPDECHDRAGSPEHGEQLSHWRSLLIEVLRDRPEGFTDGTQLIPGRPYPPVLSSSALVQRATAVILTSARDAPVRVDLDKRVGRVRPIHGVNVGPIHREGLVDLSDLFAEVRFPTVRLHDCPYAFRDVVDVPCIFPLFHLDADDPRNYRFRRTDAYLKSILDAGCGIVYRLGVSIQGNPTYRFDTDPPADYKKWADICCNIIRHYNEGWANGYRHDIRYWEIWNEPDNGPSQWNGTMEEFARFYATTSRRIKEAFPELLVGGPGLNGAMIRSARTKLEAFLPPLQEAGCPLDFLSWHVYADRPGQLAEAAREVRKALDEHGFERTESHLNEWNLAPFGHDWRGMRSSPERSKAFFAYKNGPAGSALVAASLAALQDAPVEMTNYYSAKVFNYGMFQSQGLPHKPFYAFRAYRWMLDETPVRVRVEGSDPDGGLAALAGASEAGDQVNLLLANFGSHEKDWQVALENFAFPSPAIATWTLNDKLDLEASEKPDPRLDSSLLHVVVPRHTVRLLRIKKQA
jgi:arylsulfatase A-like enzyme